MEGGFGGWDDHKWVMWADPGGVREEHNFREVGRERERGWRLWGEGGGVGGGRDYTCYGHGCSPRGYK